MKVTALQLDISWEDREENYKRAAGFASQAAKDGTDFFILPEMFATGFSMNPSVTAEPRDGATYQFICDLAKNHQMAVLGGIVFKGDGGNYSLFPVSPAPFTSLFTSLGPLYPFCCMLGCLLCRKAAMTA